MNSKAYLLIAAICLVWQGLALAADGPREELWGQLPDGRPVHRYILSNPEGLRVELSDFGASIISLFQPDRKGHAADVVLGLNEFSDYLRPENPSMGGTIGRFAGRIANGEFTLGDKTIKLSRNDHRNHLNGGTLGFDKHLWKGTIVPGKNAVSFSRISPDGEEGYLGNLRVEVVYQLGSNSLQIDYRAQSDRDTVVNLTNHAYFNLAGAERKTIADHHLVIHADRYLLQSTDGVPTGEIASVKDTPFDFRKPSPIGHSWPENGDQPAGYNHTFALNNSDGSLALAAELSDPESGRWMQIRTTEPGLHLYTGNYLPSAPIGKNGQPYPAYAGVCLETQHFPDSPNHPAFPSTLLPKDQTYTSTTLYTFGAR